MIGMTRPRIAISILGCLLYLLFLLVAIPASWGPTIVLAGSTGSEWVVTSERGTLWSGNAVLLSNNETEFPRELGKIKWRFSPSLLFSGYFGFHVSFDGDILQLNGDIGCGPQGVLLRELTARLRPEDLGRVYAPAGVFSLSGDITFATRELAVRPKEIVGKGRIVWRDAGIGGELAKGDYGLDFSGDKNAVMLKMNTLRGEFVLNMQGKLIVAKRQLVVSGNVKTGESNRLLATLMGANDRGVVAERQIPLSTAPFDMLSAAHCP